MTLRARGTGFRLAGKFETTDGTAATGNYAILPAYDFDLSGTNPLVDDQLVSYGNGRNPADPYSDQVNLKGTAKLPLEEGNIAFWMKALFGTPATTTASGVTTLTHSSGATPLPSMTLEKGLGEIGDYYLYTGVKADSIAVDILPTGILTGTVALIARGETRSGASSAGTPTTATANRVLHRRTSVLLNSSILASVVGGNFTISNNLEEIRTVRNDTIGLPYALDEGLITVKGKLMLRYESGAMFDMGLAGTPIPLQINHGNIPSTATPVFQWNFPRIFVNRPNVPVKGPNGIEQSLDFTAALDATAACAAQFIWNHT